MELRLRPARPHPRGLTGRRPESVPACARGIVRTSHNVYYVKSHISLVLERSLLSVPRIVATLSCCHPAIILEPRLPLFLNSLALRSPSRRRCWLPIANYCEPGAPKFRPHCSNYRVNDTNCEFPCTCSRHSCKSFLAVGWAPRCTPAARDGINCGSCQRVVRKRGFKVCHLFQCVLPRVGVLVILELPGLGFGSTVRIMSNKFLDSQ